MTDTLAADAALIELTPDREDVADWLRDAALGDEGPNPLAVRDALLELAAIETRTAEVATLKAQIVERYDEKIGRLKGRVEAIRDSLFVYVDRYGKTSFPDVGGVHLTTRNKGGKVKLDDAVVFEDYVRVTWPKVVETCVETVEVFDHAKALEIVMDELDVRVTAGGKIVDVGTGEDKTEQFAAVGVTVTEESKSLAVRKS